VIGVTRNDNTQKDERLQQVLRLELDEKAGRAFAIVEPLKVTITNFNGSVPEMMEAPCHPKKPEMGMRQLPFGKTLYIEASDFREEDVKGYFGLAPGKEVRLLHAYNIKCEEVVKDAATGKVVELKCSYDPDKKAKLPKGKLHWVEKESAVACEMRLYDLLFTVEEPLSHDDWLTKLSSNSLVVEKNSLVEPSVAEYAAAPCTSFQFQRLGYFTVDLDSKKGALVFNRSVTLKQSNATKAATATKK
jgi:glutaminyl-tRNA synthetase